MPLTVLLKGNIAFSRDIWLSEQNHSIEFQVLVLSQDKSYTG